MNLRFENKGVVLHFDDYDIQEDGSAWSRVCANCRDRYRDTLGDRPDESGDALGTCGVVGCYTDADDFVDFAADEITEVAENPEVPNKYTIFADARAAATHLYTTLKGNSYSVYGLDDREGKWTNETVVAKVSVNGFDAFIANSRYGHAPFVCEAADEVNFIANFTNYLVEKVGAEKYAIVPPIERDARYGLEEQVHQLRFFPGKLPCGNYDLRSVPLSAFAEWLAKANSNDSVVGFTVDFLMEGNRKLSDTWFRIALYPLGDFNIAVVSDGDMFAALTQRSGIDAGTFAATFVAAIRTAGFQSEDVMLPPVVAGWVRATMKQTMDAEAFMDYIKANFTLDITTQRIVKNVITYTELFKDHSDKWDFIEAMLNDTGVDLSREEIEMFE